MKILLDTQVFIWLVNDDPRLGAQAKKVVVSTQNQVYISFLSLFEMAIKAAIGKLSFDPSIMNDLESMGIELVPGDSASLSQYQVFNEENKDPFDNFLVAVAKTRDYVFLTSDRSILSADASGVSIMDATV
ncbi:MAG: type II toxin-antitoxin system VapC family toxin [Pseudomonadales bacterium]|nr:type II toxin-antitoxin system VapC family toxin [Pseudomonadales bacterium]